MLDGEPYNLARPWVLMHHIISIALAVPEPVLYYWGTLNGSALDDLLAAENIVRDQASYFITGDSAHVHRR